MVGAAQAPGERLLHQSNQEPTGPGPGYEGSAAVTGTYDHRPVTGNTCIELTNGR